MYSTSNAAEILMVTYDDIDGAITFANGQKVPSVKSDFVDVDFSQVEGFVLDDNYTSWSGYKVINSADPDGLYGAREFGSFDENEEWVPEGYQIDRYIYSEKYDTYLADRNFEKENRNPFGAYQLTNEEFENSTYSIVKDEYDNYVDNDFNCHGTDIYALKYTDKSGNEYAVSTFYTDDGQIDIVFDLVPVEEFDDFYLLQENPNVKYEDLEIVVNETPVENTYIYRLDATDYIYEGVVAASVNGDLNADNTLDITDVVMSRAHIVGNTTLTQEQIAAGDMNGDKVLDIIDVVMMRKAIVG